MSVISKNIGVLALNGSFNLHLKKLEKLNVLKTPVFSLFELDQVDALIIPSSLFKINEFILKDLILEIKKRTNMPILLTGESISFLKKIKDSFVNNNSFQVKINPDSVFQTKQIKYFFSDTRTYEVCFFKNPQILKTPPKSKILAEDEKKEILAFEYENIILTSFLPEYNTDYNIYEYLLTKI
jgi:glutamine amidotransferase PdxT